MMTDRVLHILGNGPSAKQYTTYNNPGLTIGCNAPPPFVKNLWATCIGDYKMIAAIDKGFLESTDINFIMGLRPKMYCNEHTSFYMRMAPRIKEFYTEVPSYTNPHKFSVGHLATHYACTKFEPDIVHMWGFDSMFNTDLRSYTDNFVKSNRDPENQHRMNTNWRSTWQHLFNEFPDIDFIVHYPKTLEIQFDVGYNVHINKRK